MPGATLGFTKGFDVLAGVPWQALGSGIIYLEIPWQARRLRVSKGRDERPGVS